jgi:dihydrofolate synthase/folylpolyglutamate synthase
MAEDSRTAGVNLGCPMTMTFQDAMRWVEEEHGFPEDPSHYHYRRAAWLLERSGLAEQIARIPTVVIAGSCGKASTARFLAYMVTAAGKTVGLGTKPPLHETLDGNRERYQLFRPAPATDNNIALSVGYGLQHSVVRREGWIEPDVFTRLVERLRPVALEAEREFGLLAAYDLRLCLLAAAFVEWNVDYAIVEANIGLRQDVARAWPSPRVVGLTPVGTDHAALLRAPDPASMPSQVRACLDELASELGDAVGPTWHKAGDVWPGVPLVLGRQSAAVLKLIQHLNPNAVCDWELFDRESTMSGSRARLNVAGHEARLDLRTVGGFHLDNAALAASLAARLLAAPDAAADTAFVAAVEAGAARADTPGRMQRVDDDPITLVNVAMSHTKVQATLEAASALLVDDARLIVVAHFLERVHRVRDCAADIARHARVAALVPTANHHDPRAINVPAATLAEWAREANAELTIEAIEPPAAALLRARQLARAAVDIVVVIGDGSFF